MRENLISGSAARLVKTPLRRSGTTETLLENEDRRAGCRPESPRVRENLISQSVSDDSPFPSFVAKCQFIFFSKNEMTPFARRGFSPSRPSNTPEREGIENECELPLPVRALGQDQLECTTARDAGKGPCPTRSVMELLACRIGETTLDSNRGQGERSRHRRVRGSIENDCPGVEYLCDAVDDRGGDRHGLHWTDHAGPAEAIRRGTIGRLRREGTRRFSGQDYVEGVSDLGMDRRNV
jgi:hypothetical protein